jgi:hypothetical protein
MSKTPDNVYLNTDVANTRDIFFQGGIGFPLRYSEQRTDPILDNPSDYDVCVSRFSIPVQGIPLIIVPIENGQTNINKSVWYVTLNKGSNYYQEALIHQPTQFGGTTSPTAGTLMTEAIQVEFYYYYSYFQIDDFLRIINKALSDAFTSLKASETVTSTLPPVFTYDYNTKLFSFYCQYSYIADGISLFVNEALYSKIDAIDSNYFRTPLYQLCDFKLVIEVRNQNYFIPDGYTPPATQSNPLLTPAVPSYLIFTQNFQMTSNFPTFRSIVFTTTMPVLREQISNGFDQINNSANQSQSILTDFLTTFEVDISRQSAQYFPTIWRWISLQSNTPLYRVDFAVFWSDTKGNLYPVYLPPRTVANIKLYFRKRISKKLEYNL